MLTLLIFNQCNAKLRNSELNSDFSPRLLSKIFFLVSHVPFYNLAFLKKFRFFPTFLSLDFGR